ncbi:Pentachlorophenol 4-monooxygenase [Actinomadura rubteroloni]|uniref:Pentachlorophenol 4-monooxygenase n=1 Tax=Actinomadura rubteroloni TaxID=1926885 RepID=A0A2P4UE83_9ACTN|nr:FAD-dependent monooxygenase [Actinomadura rubteroloni]POM23322.1 Pentachlorophenol 4-monooxygenase [Actinomadura rubteroloni]
MDPAQVLVIGAGPCGLAAACELLRHGTTVRIVDAHPQPAAGSRSILLWPPQLAILRDHGLLDEALDLGIRPESFTYSTDKRRLARFRFADDTAPLILPQHHTDRLLEKALNTMGVTVERPVRVTDVTQTPGGVRAQVTRGNGETGTLDAPWLIAADGAHSTVRTVLNVAAVRARATSRFLLAEGNLAPAPARTEIEYVLTDKGALLVAPLPGDLYRIAGDVTDTADPTAEAAQALLRRRNHDAKISDLTLLTHFTSEEALVRDMRVGRVFLLGDAAHIHYPVGGQGANLGMQDARNLAWKLVGVINGQLNPDILDTYSVERRSAAEQILRMTGIVARVALLRPPWNSARNVLLRSIQGSPAVQAWYVAKLAGQKTSYPNTPLGAPVPVRPHRLGRLSSASVVGRPSPTWARPEERTSLFRVVSKGPTENSEITARAEELARAHPIATHQHVIGPKEECVLIRPDGYVAVAAATSDLTDIARLLTGIRTTSH